MARPKTLKRVSQKESGATVVTTKNGLASRGKSLVFISHDSRDADLAEFFANLLSDVSGGTLKSFRSSDKKGTAGIEFGTEWYKSIMSQLGEATDVVALLTQQSIDRPWILYEAGVAKGKLDTNVLGVALGVPLEKVSAGPFGQFQNCGDDEDSLTKLVMQLLQRNPEASPREEAVRRQVRVFLEEVKQVLADEGRGAPGDSADADETNIAKLFEEVKAMVRELPDRVDDRVRTASKRRLREFDRFDPMMEKLLIHPVLAKRPAEAWLGFISVLRDDFPWIYDVGLPLYQALITEDLDAIIKATDNFSAIVEVMTHGPMVYQTGDQEYFLIRRLPELVRDFLQIIHRPRGKPRTLGRKKSAEIDLTDNYTSMTRDDVS